MSSLSADRIRTRDGGLLAVLGLVLALTVSSSFAQTIILGNLASPAPNFQTTLNAAASPVQTKAVSFTMGSTLDPVAVKLLLQNYQSSVDTPVVRIVTNDAGNLPSATVVGTFNAPASASDASGIFTFNASSSFSLTSGTTYWLTVTASAGSFDWQALTSVAAAPTGTATFGEFAHYTGVWNHPSGSYNYFELTAASAVPEPSTYAVLAGAVVLGLAVWRRRVRVTPSR